MEREVLLKTEQDTIDLATTLAKDIKKGTVITLTGDLGAGKTFFAGAFINELIRPQQKINVPSPTFNLVKKYTAKDFDIYHFDLYRIKRPEELEELDLQEAFSQVSLIEWPAIAEDFLPSTTLDLTFNIVGDTRLCRIVDRRF